MNTASNSRPLAECTVISWIASCPAWAWLSPASSAAWVRKAASGRHDLAGLGVGHRGLGRRRLLSSTGSATASLPKPSWVTKLSAALTSSSRFSMRSWPSFSVL
jgi:hypothetical protein